MIRKLNTYSMILSVTALLVMVLMVVVEILARTFFMYSFLVVDEMVGYLMVTIVFLGLIFSFDNDGFVRVESFYSRFTNKVRWIVDILFLFFLFLYSSTLTYYIVKLNFRSYVMESKSFSSLQTLLYIPQLSMSIGIFSFTLYVVLVLSKKLIRGRG